MYEKPITIAGHVAWHFVRKIIGRSEIRLIACHDDVIEYLSLTLLYVLNLGGVEVDLVDFKTKFSESQAYLIIFELDSQSSANLSYSCKLLVTLLAIGLMNMKP